MYIFKSKDINLNYAAKICKVDEIIPIEWASNITYAVVRNNKVVVDKDTKVGDILVYFPCECAICPKILRELNLYANAKLNSNYEEGKATESVKGLFDKNGRVKMKKIRDVYSFGFAIPISLLEQVYPDLIGNDWNMCVDMQFDVIGDSMTDDKICWKYIPKFKEPVVKPKARSYKKAMKRLNRFDRIIPTQFRFHYDTYKLEDNVSQFRPTDNITITTKVHGASIILSRVLCKKKLSIFEKFKKFIGFTVNDYEYGNVYSSRRVIKNRYINPGATSKGNAYYSSDIYSCVNRDFSGFLDRGMTIYGEVVGYLEGTDKYIQKNHDYGCKVGTWKFMPYRITTTDQLGNVTEWEIDKVYDWVYRLKTYLHLTKNPVYDKLMLLDILYEGEAGKMYDNLYDSIFTNITCKDIEDFYNQRFEMLKNGNIPWKYETINNFFIDKWRTKWLESMKNDKTMLQMECDEPLCNNKVPREGVVIRKCNDKVSEAFKLKSAAHYDIERKQHDKGETDMEETN